MHGLALIHVVRDLPGVAKFKIVRESVDRTKVLLVAGSSFDPRGRGTDQGGNGEVSRVPRTDRCSTARWSAKSPPNDVGASALTSV